MLDSNECWRETLEEASVRHLSSKLRMLLAIMLYWSNSSNPISLWEEFKHQLLEDKLFHYRRRLGNMHLYAKNEISNQALIDLEEKVHSVGGKLLQDYDLPAANRKISDQPLEVLFEQNHDVHYLENFVTENVTKLTDGQKVVYDTIVRDVYHQGGTLFLLMHLVALAKLFLQIYFLSRLEKVVTLLLQWHHQELLQHFSLAVA